MQYLTQKELKEMMLLSYERIEKEKEEINKINIFPVPDQDTGNNIAKTLLGIKEAIKGKEFKNLEDISEAILDGALINAQGNAGVIYTGFLAGFLPQLDKNPADTKKLSLAFEKGAERARISIQNPQEGTILDVIDAAASAIKKEAEKESDIVSTFKKAIEKAGQALLATREKMEIFKKANVVDAGGLGFLIILESYLGALEKPSIVLAAEDREEIPSKKIKRFIQVLANRYEVVSLIENSNFDEQEVQEKLKKLGNCLDIVKVKNKMKIHIHTDYPDEVKKVMGSLGQIQKLRVEDMAREVVGEESVRKISIGIITDEIADLTPKIIERYQIEVIPCKVDWPESKRLGGKNIYQKMRNVEKQKIKNLPKTSQPSPKEFLEAYKRQLKNFEKVLCISPSSKLSGVYNLACQTREMLPEEQRKKVFVLDSYNGSCGQALLTLRAIELIQSQTEIGEIMLELKKEIPKIQLYAFLANPKWLEWGGRIKRSQANWIRRLQKIGIKPLLGLKKGKIEKIGFRARTKESSEAIFREIKSKSKKIRKQNKKIRVIITHCDNSKEAKKLKKKLKEIKAEVSFINLTSSVVGAHIGPGSLVAAWITIE
ncbi:MAG: DegV family protein [Candidatus Nealsonbacteria bacterium]